MNRILSSAQACAVYAAMVQCNNIGASVHIRIPSEDWVVHAVEYADGAVVIFEGTDNGYSPMNNFESYASQNEFVLAYNL